MSKKLERNGLWESSRMMLPDHKETYIAHQMHLDKIKVRPMLDEDQLQEINRTIAESMEYDQAVTITYVDRGEVMKFEGRVKKVNSQERWLKIANGEELDVLMFGNIVDVE